MWSDWIWISVLAVGAVVYGAWKLLTVQRWRAGRRPFLTAAEETVLITGCDTGIGHQCARLYDRLGFRVFAGCLSPQGPGAMALLAETSRVQVVELDVTNDQKVKLAYDTIEAAVGDRGLWGLVNNAGILCYGEFQWYTWNQCQKQIEVNLTGAIRMVHTFLPLIRRRRGRIVTVTSVNGLLAFPAQTVYCATKFGLEGFCNSLRLELARDGVAIVAIQLGDFARLTNIFANHSRDVDEMWAAMSDEERRNQENYFWNFHRRAEENCGLASPRSYGDSRLFTDLEDAMTASKPRSRYLCMPPVMGLGVRILLLLPPSWTDALLALVFRKALSKP